MFIYSGCSMIFCNVDMKSEARASSMNRRSNERVALMAVNGSPGSPPISCRPLPTAKMAHCGGFMMAVNSLIPNMPKLEIVKVPPWKKYHIKIEELDSAEIFFFYLNHEKGLTWNSSSMSLPSLALPAKSLTTLAISSKDRLGTFLTIGVIKPFGVATATEMSMLVITCKSLCSNVTFCISLTIRHQLRDIWTN